MIATSSTSKIVADTGFGRYSCTSPTSRKEVMLRLFLDIIINIMMRNVRDLFHNNRPISIFQRRWWPAGQRLNLQQYFATMSHERPPSVTILTLSFPSLLQLDLLPCYVMDKISKGTLSESWGANHLAGCALQMSWAARPGSSSWDLAMARSVFVTRMASWQLPVILCITLSMNVVFFVSILGP